MICGFDSAGALPVRCNLTLNMTIDRTRSVVVPCPYRCTTNTIAHNILWHGVYAASSRGPRNHKEPRWPKNAILELEYLLKKPYSFLGKHPAFAEKFEEDVRRAWDEQPGKVVTPDMPVVTESPKMKMAEIKMPRKGRSRSRAVSVETPSVLWEPVLVASNCPSTPTPDSDDTTVPHYYADGFNCGPSTFHSAPIKLSNAYPRRVLANIKRWGIYDQFFNLPF